MRCGVKFRRTSKVDDTVNISRVTLSLEVDGNCGIAGADTNLTATCCYACYTEPKQTRACLVPDRTSYQSTKLLQQNRRVSLTMYVAQACSQSIVSVNKTDTAQRNHTTCIRTKLTGLPYSDYYYEFMRLKPESDAYQILIPPSPDMESSILGDLASCRTLQLLFKVTKQLFSNAIRQTRMTVLHMFHIKELQNTFVFSMLFRKLIMQILAAINSG
ncbi:hypothetical protein CBL_12272 [Carabus blaptoides fortunei]